MECQKYLGTPYAMSTESGAWSVGWWGTDRRFSCTRLSDAVAFAPSGNLTLKIQRGSVLSSGWNSGKLLCMQGSTPLSSFVICASDHTALQGRSVKSSESTAVSPPNRRVAHVLPHHLPSCSALHALARFYCPHHVSSCLLALRPSSAFLLRSWPATQDAPMRK